MSILRSCLAVVRWSVAAVVGYWFIHAGAQSMTQVAMGLHRDDRALGELLSLLVLGLVELVAVLGLFAVPIRLRVLAAAVLLAILVVPTGMQVGPEISVSCIAATVLLILLPEVPQFEAWFSRQHLQALGVDGHRGVSSALSGAEGRLSSLL